MKDELNITYINTDINNYNVEFYISGPYKNKEMNEYITISLRQLISSKLINRNINTSLDFLTAIKKLKDNLDKRKTKKTIVNLAYENHKMHQNELEELSLMIELIKSKKEKSKTVTYDRKGNLHFEAEFSKLTD